MARPDRKDTSKARRRRADRSPSDRRVAGAGEGIGTNAPPPNPTWFVPVMVGLMVIGLLWVVTYYLTAGQYPVTAWHNWNLAIGFAFMISGFLMTTRWR